MEIVPELAPSFGVILFCLVPNFSTDHGFRTSLPPPFSVQRIGDTVSRETGYSMKLLKREIAENGRVRIYFCGKKIFCLNPKNAARLQKILRILRPKKTCIYNERLIPKNGFVYKGNKEYGVFNLDIRLNQEVFEFGDMIALNQAIGTHLLGDAKSVVNIGAGVGTFENQNSVRFPNTKFVASEFDTTSINWAKENRPFDNVEYCSDDMKTILERHGKFDVAVCVDVIEHITNYKEFLDDFVTLSDVAIIATPNRDRYTTASELTSPPYEYHPLEFNAGEFYFILKMYFKDVNLYSQIEEYLPDLTPVGIYSSYPKLIAVCSNVNH